MDKQTLEQSLQQHFADKISICESIDMPTIEVSAENLLAVCQELRDNEQFRFEQLIDLCAVDYSDYGYTHWRTEETTETGYSRGVAADDPERVVAWDKPRFAVVYHLISVSHNHRCRVKVYLEQEPEVASVIDIWNVANWFEREAFDLYGVVFNGHPDLRRLLTDYGFKGHPFRKDFPLIGEVELRYDAALARCVYEPVSINPRVLVPKVIRDDNRYRHPENEEGNPNA